MMIKERTSEAVELDKEMLNEANGGCWLGGMIGTHTADRPDESIILPGGSFTKFTCEDCDKVYYSFKDNASGECREISKAEFETVYYAFNNPNLHG